MPVLRLDEDGPAAVQAALGDASVLARYRAKIVTVPGSECLWWAHAVSGRGHGRFWLARGRVVPADGRARALTVTSEGAALANSANTAAEGVDRTFFRPLANERQHFTDLLQRLAHSHP